VEDLRGRVKNLEGNGLNVLERLGKVEALLRGDTGKQEAPALGRRQYVPAHSGSMFLG
jgi:hypothetical protein